MKKRPSEAKSHSQVGLEELLKDANLPEASALGVLGLVQMGSEALLRAAVIDEINHHLGRLRYEHGPGSVPGATRNGSRLTRIDTPLGPVEYQRPRVAGAPEFQSRFHTPYMRRPEEFAASIADMYVSGVSTRKVKHALKAVAGSKARLSRSTVSRITQKLRDEFDEWSRRDLSQLDVRYVFLDAIRVGMRRDSFSKQAVLVAYAVLAEGGFEVLSIGLGHSESDKSWGNFVGDLKRRGLKDPLLAVSDGNVSVIKAIETYWPDAYRQRCTKHRMENILEKIPREAHEKVRPLLHRIFYGAASLEQARMFVTDFKRRFAKVYPAAYATLTEDLAQCLSFYLFPHKHWRRLRTSNCLERMNLEIRRRLNVIGRHPTETGCLALIFQVTRRYAKDQKQRSFSVDELTEKQWEKLRAEKTKLTEHLVDLVNKAA